MGEARRARSAAKKKRAPVPTPVAPVFYHTVGLPMAAEEVLRRIAEKAKVSNTEVATALLINVLWTTREVEGMRSQGAPTLPGA